MSNRWGRTAAQLAALNPTGEVGRIEVESDTGRGKVYNGLQPWNLLPYLWAIPDDVSGGGATNLAYDAATRVVSSDTGTDATLTLADGTNPGLMTSADFTKLAGVATGATANSSDATLLDRANHTGTQATSTITGLDATLAAASALITTNISNIAANTAAIATKAAIPTLAILRRQHSDFFNTGTAQNLPFIGAAISSGTGTTSVNVTGSHGALRLASSATANSGYRWQTNGNIQAEVGMFFRGIIAWTGGAFTDRVVRLGFHKSTTAADATDGIYIEVLEDQASLKCAAASSMTAAATAWTVAALDTLYVFDVILNAVDLVTLTIRDLAGTLLATQTVTTNIPSGAAQAFFAGAVATKTSTGAANLVILDSMEFGLAREVIA